MATVRILTADSEILCRVEKARLCACEHSFSLLWSLNYGVAMKKHLGQKIRLNLVTIAKFKLARLALNLQK